MSDHSDDVDPANPRPGNYGYHDSEWDYVPEDLAETIAAGPADASEGGIDDWVLGLSAAVPESHPHEAEKVYIRLHPRALNQLYMEIKGLTAENRQAGHRAECKLCGEIVNLDDALPDGESKPTHPECWADVYQTPLWW